MPIISQNLTLPGNVQTGGTIQASDVATLYQAMNAFNIPGTIGVWQQGLVDNNRYQSTGTGTIDWTFTTPANKAIFFMVPFTWSGSTGINVFQLRINGASATTSTGMAFANASSGDGFILGFIGPRSTDTARSGFCVGMDSVNTTFKPSNISVSMTTADTTSVGFLSGSTAAGATFVYNGVRFWTEG
jgi:hypothetical protein